MSKTQQRLHEKVDRPKPSMETDAAAELEQMLLNDMRRAELLRTANMPPGAGALTTRQCWAVHVAIGALRARS